MEQVGVVVFFAHVLIIVIGGLVTVFAKSIIRALTGLIATLFGVAGLYFLMAAPFIGVMQVLIYVGAVSVLIFLAIAFTKASSTGEEGQARSLGQYALVVSLPLLVGLVLGYLIFKFIPSQFLKPEEISVKDLGGFFLGPYMLPFELISVVLLVAMLGAVILGLEKKAKKEE